VGDVAFDLFDQRLERREFRLAANPTSDFDACLAAVEVAGEIEDVGFDDDAMFRVECLFCADTERDLV
jgi:hypothetical protein